MQNHNEDIRKRAYELWEQAGSPPGREQDFWLRAEQEITGSGAQAASKKPKPAKKAASPKKQAAAKKPASRAKPKPAEKAASPKNPKTGEA